MYAYYLTNLYNIFLTKKSTAPVDDSLSAIYKQSSTDVVQSILLLIAIVENVGYTAIGLYLYYSGASNPGHLFDFDIL